MVVVEAVSSTGDIFKSQRKCRFLVYSGAKEQGSSDIFTIFPNEKIEREFSFNGKKELDIILIDANTKAQLDKAISKKSAARDLGGL